MMPYHLWDGGTWTTHGTLQAATAAAAISIDHARDACDPEWPMWVEEIVVTHGPADADDKSDLPVVLIATETNIRRPSSELDEDGYDDEGESWSSTDAYQCEYAMRPPVNTTEGE